MRARFGFLLVVMIAFAQGCAEVKPWERGLLSHPSIDTNNPARAVREAFMRHTLDVREGSVGGDDTAGGGCGCN